MSAKILHIVNTLTPTLNKEQGDIMRLMGLWLPFGRLFRNFTQDEIFRYCDDLKVRFPFGYIYRFAISLLTMLCHDFSQYEKIIVWHNKDVHEQLFFLLICKIVEVPLYEISTSESAFDHIEYDESKVKYIPQDEHLFNMGKWDSLAQSDSMLRIIGKGGIEEVSEDFFDARILRSLYKCGLNLWNFTGKLMCTAIFNRSLGNSAEEFIYSRIIEKVKAGELNSYALSNGRWKKADDDIFTNGTRYHEIKVSLPRNYSLPSEKKTLCLFPDKVDYASSRKFEYDCDSVTFPSWILPFGRLPKSFDISEWEKYGMEMEKMMRIKKASLSDELMTFFNIDFASYSKVIVIHGSSVNEQLFFAMINTLTDHPVYEWDISHCTNEGLIMDTGEVSREVLESVILDEVAEIVTQEKKKECKKLWEQITESSRELRINEDNQIKNVPIDYLDEEIIDVCVKDEKNNYYAQALKYALLQSHGLSFGALNRFVPARMYQLAIDGKIFPYYRETKKKIRQISNEQLKILNPRKVFMRRYSMNQLTRSLFE